MDVKKGIIKWHQVELTQNVQKEREDILHVDEEEKEYEVVLPKHLEPGDSIGLTGKGGAATVHLKTQDEDVLLCFSPSRPNLKVKRNWCIKKSWSESIEEEGEEYPFSSAVSVCF